ncbi:MAG: cyclophilin-like fold protein [Nitrosopumilus sp.]|nr:cyclophilin-like fold protein [Nitrosopumilus sp.]
MSGGSVSKSHVILEITGKFKIKCELKRHLSPSLVGTINRSLPITGTIHMLGTSGVYVESNIESGGERTRNEFKKGDIAFLSVGHSFCFFHKDTKVGKDLIPIGKILDDPEDLLKSASGDEVSIYCDIG